MPNYCENGLIIKGPTEALEDFVAKHFIEGGFSFETIIPEPETIKECPEEFIIPVGDRKVRLDFIDEKEWFNWYDWRCKFWGTKWDASDSCHSITLTTLLEGTLSISFLTAWSPCVPIVQKLMELYSDLNFEYTYFEPGMWFAGRVYSNGGCFIHSKCRNEDIKQFSIDYGFMTEEDYAEMEEE